jgi:hypothetical protein
MLLDAWIKYTLLPLVQGAVKSKIPLKSIAGALAGATVRVALQAAMTKDDLGAVLDESWARQAANPPPPPP